MALAIAPLYGNVVPYQNIIVPTDAGRMASISRGRPANPTSIPIIGVHTPTMVRCRMAEGSVFGHFTDRVSSNITAQTPRLRIGADKPTKLARDRQSTRVGIFKYFTHPQRRMKGESMPSAVSQSTSEYYAPTPLSPSYFLQRISTQMRRTLRPKFGGLLQLFSKLTPTRLIFHQRNCQI
jgi:hypothetical protein